ncbi:hypothetical protein [Micromonospora saelicesensis]|uniref:AP2/ERF domain-containing protein n=1 Tax=Micromonospora saelicesensis TaxID=285676 RepID=A0A1C4XQZ6_9ACTN|nr:hypothetical protein [Micromonospora saelicesensis]RAO00352.1 hypothetical protein GAR05_02322 [Micromonospora saelicesensis]RAO49314.1 hypothetical protein GAR06_01142 [Micromonospora saelicesensis]RAO51053.1 hypothetical protein PSN01_04350 [Micromonospora saelicesensis]RAO60612.1 hypothetical protein LUPAC06_01235 [Micromonospora saelicesensis]SCF10776.1 hypothetical protein GA0070561_3627 [Micromonospora saelicesensis]
METVVFYQFVTEVPQAAAIWSTLFLLTLGLLAVLAARPERDRPTDDPLPAGPTPRELAAAEAVDLRRYAEEVAVAAAGAATTAKRWRAAWLTAQEQLEQARIRYDEADTAARRFAGAGALPTPQTPHTPAEYAARERYLHRAAMAAYWRGDLTMAQLGDVFGHRRGWDPRRHPVEQEVLISRVVRDARLADYQVAADRERAAWRDAELAAESARALAEEAYAAAARLRPTVVPARRTVAGALRPAVVARWRPARVG